MDIFSYGRALSEMWSLGGQTMVAAQEATMKAVAAGMGGAPSMPGGMPDLAAFQALAGDSAEFARATQAMSAMWSSAVSLSEALVKNLPGAENAGAGDAKDLTAEATFRKMTDPRAWLGATGELDDVLSRLSEGPRFSDLWDVERRYARVFRAWFGVRQRSLEHNTVLLAAWQRSAQIYGERLGELSKGERPADAAAMDTKALLRLWTETANQVLIEAQRSEPFLDGQAKLIKASTELRLAQHDLVEYYGERFGFPTRRELDDLAKTVSDLKRELRALRREARREPPASAAPAAPPASAPPRAPRAVSQRKARG